ncbi:MAG: fumarylacetoacetate hydrolase family protein [Devosia sp.]
MRLLSFLRDGKASYGCVTESGVIDLARIFNSEAPDLKALIANNLVNVAATHGARHKPSLALKDLQLLPVIPNPGKIICVGLNYEEHVRETKREVTRNPTLFLRVNESQVAHGQVIVLPAETVQLDYEGEIAVIVGKPGRRIAQADAWGHVVGYACYNDGSVRDWQAAANQWTAGKNFWRTGAFGPWMVTADEIPPGQTMTLVTRLNGKKMQRATTDMMIHSIPQLISHISTFTPLRSGDVIVTGTPGGIGSRRNPPVFMGSGDVVEVEVNKIGILRNVVACEISDIEDRFYVEAKPRSVGRSG